jgi:hypothetical protein
VRGGQTHFGLFGTWKSGAVAVSVFVGKRRAPSSFFLTSSLFFKLLHVDPSTILGHGSDCLRKRCIGFLHIKGKNHFIMTKRLLVCCSGAAFPLNECGYTELIVGSKSQSTWRGSARCDLIGTRRFFFHTFI